MTAWLQGRYSCSADFLWLVSSAISGRCAGILIISRLDYCNLPTSTLAPLQRVLNAANRLVMNLGPRGGQTRLQRSENKACLLRESIRCSGTDGLEQAPSRHPVNPRYWTIQETTEDYFYSALHTPSVPYLASKQTTVCCRLIVLRVRLFLTGIPRDTCQEPLVNL